MAKIITTKKNNISTEITAEEYSYNSANANWFPGHMLKAMNKIKENLKRVDVVLEIRDARSPLATSNISFTDTIKEKPSLIVFNKTNLAKAEVISLWEEWLNKKDENFIFINGLDKNSVTKIIQRSKDILNKYKKDNDNLNKKNRLKMMIIGLPNTGKSTIINTLSNRNASKVADKPGQTQKELWVKASNDLDILDTPGVLAPTISNKNQALQLSALNAISERIMDAEDTACFLVEHLLMNNAEKVKEHFKIENLTNNLVETLNQIAKVRGCILNKNEFDYERVYQVVINDFRKGCFGPVSLERPPVVTTT
ncbi:MAG: ribosome biogenesis GTPase YlqF [Halobacteriovoraceae bacterium]|nr:ribosome biogenesis GTPase YlqF [Halobacteriovoraceae bacterium]